MTKLTTIQSELLTAAVQSIEGTTTAAPKSKGAAAGLIKRGFFVSIPQTEGPSLLSITPAGREAIGADEVPAAAEPRTPEAAPAPAPAPKEPKAKESKAKEPKPTEPKPQEPKGKIAALVALLRQDGGTTIEAMMAATGWQAHSVRGAMSGAIKKGLGLAVVSEKTDAGRLYRIPVGADA